MDPCQNFGCGTGFLRADLGISGMKILRPIYPTGAQWAHWMATFDGLLRALLNKKSQVNSMLTLAWWLVLTIFSSPLVSDNIITSGIAAVGERWWGTHAGTSRSPPSPHTLTLPRYLPLSAHANCNGRKRLGNTDIISARRGPFPAV